MTAFVGLGSGLIRKSGGCQIGSLNGRTWHLTSSRQGRIRRGHGTKIKMAVVSSTEVDLRRDILKRLRERMISEQIDAFIVPSPDPHNSEYASDCFNRRTYVSGFDGSAGTAVITLKKALLWTDGRYFLQAEQQLTPAWELMKAGTPGVPTIEEWLAENVKAKGTVGIDPYVHSISNAGTLREALEKANKKLVFLEENPVDSIWRSRPGYPKAPVRVHPIEYAGTTAAEKVKKIREEMKKEDVDCMLVSMLDEVAWLLNIRGDDIPCCPVVLSYVIVEKDAVTLFVDPKKIREPVRSYLKKAGVRTDSYENAKVAVVKLAACGKKFWLNPASTSAAMHAAANQRDRALVKVTPIPLMKAVKNVQEAQGMLNAHYKDGAALCNFFTWLEKEIVARRSISEVQVAKTLKRFRSQQKDFLGESFPAIAGSGANGAIIHYRAVPATCGDVTTDQLFLLDSGGQYLDGTTDVTRTIHLGTPTRQEVEAFTRVLKGHIAIDSAVFPEGTTGNMLDPLARMPLWEVGLDYRHGTGHGVGACLNVHEGPHGISPRATTTGLQPGMIVSNEPGYYEDGKFGIRIENLLIVKEADTANKFNDKPYYGFSRLTHAPFQRKMIDVKMLTPTEIAWINKYHRDVRERILPRVNGEEAEWLTRNTAPLEVPRPVGSAPASSAPASSGYGSSQAGYSRAPTAGYGSSRAGYSTSAEGNGTVPPGYEIPSVGSGTSRGAYGYSSTESAAPGPSNPAPPATSSASSAGSSAAWSGPAKPSDGYRTSNPASATPTAGYGSSRADTASGPSTSAYGTPRAGYSTSPSRSPSSPVRSATQSSPFAEPPARSTASSTPAASSPVPAGSAASYASSAEDSSKDGENLEYSPALTRRELFFIALAGIWLAILGFGAPKVRSLQRAESVAQLQ
mmetsp:Transcript_1596/g.5724  ORF Transcript_1596/g.5724 Transcript_1596/m.5724 type:complete len:909 (-) Transcript_1596:993-3719(-)